MKAPPSKTTEWREHCRRLERLAEDLLRPLGLRRERTRLRRLQSGRAVVDTVFGSNQLHFRRWHVRCADTPKLTVDQAATEVGIAQGAGNRVALLITTGTVSAAAKRYARLLNATTPYNVILLRQADLETERARRNRLPHLINRQAPLALMAVPHRK